MVYVKYTLLGVIVILACTAIFEADKIPSCCPTQSAQGASGQSAPAGVIRIAGDDPRLPQLAAQMSAWTRAGGITFEAVPGGSAAAVTVDFLDNLNHAPQGEYGTDGVSWGGGNIEIRNAAREPAWTLLHEIVHEGGYGYHDDDPSSLMHGPHGHTILPQHYAALRNLTGSGGFLGGFSLLWLAVPIVAFWVLKK